GRFGRLGRVGLAAFAVSGRGLVVIAAATIRTLGAVGTVRLLVLVLHDQRLLGVGFVAAHHQVPQGGVVEAEALDERGGHVLAGFDVEQHVVGLDQVVDRVGQLAAPPVFQAVDLAFAVLDQRLVTLDHRRHLLALVRMDQEHDFVMTHGLSFRVFGRPRGPRTAPGARNGRGGARSLQLRAAGSRALWRINGLRASWPRAARGSWPDPAPVRTPDSPRCEGRRVGLARLSPVSAAGRLGPVAPGAPAQAARSASVVKLSPQPHSAAARGLAKTNSWFRPLRTKSMVVPSTIGWLVAST